MNTMIIKGGRKAIAKMYNAIDVDREQLPDAITTINFSQEGDNLKVFELNK